MIHMHEICNCAIFFVGGVAFWRITVFSQFSKGNDTLMTFDPLIEHKFGTMANDDSHTWDMWLYCAFCRRSSIFSENHIFDHIDLWVTFDLDLVIWQKLSPTPMLVTKFGWNPSKHAWDIARLTEERKKKKKERKKCEKKRAFGNIRCQMQLVTICVHSWTRAFGKAIELTFDWPLTQMTSLDPYKLTAGSQARSIKWLT